MFKNKRLIVVIVVVAVASSLMGGFIARNTALGGEVFDYIDVFASAFSAIERNYVDSVSPKDLIHGAIKGMTATLDQYSEFMSPETYNDFRVDTSGKFGGLGIQISIRDGILTVISPVDDTPAFRAGVQAGDKIIEIDGEPTTDITILEAVKKLRGRVGTSVTITVRRDEDKIIPYTIVRGIITISSVKGVRIIDEEAKIGYIRIVEFREDLAEETEKGLSKLEDEGMEALILDLRYNPGGLLRSAIEVSSKFIKEGELIVFTKGRQSRRDVRGVSQKGNTRLDIPLVVLINRGSASASEILAGAVKDHKRGIIIGTQSFGKGSVQTVINLRDGSGMRLTTAKWFTPSGNPIEGVGIEPDVISEIPSLTEAEEDALRKIREEEFVINFLDKNPTPSASEIEDFMSFIKEEGIEISDKILLRQIRFLTDDETDDILSDPQLLRAVGYLKDGEYQLRAENTQ